MARNADANETEVLLKIFKTRAMITTIINRIFNGFGVLTCIGSIGSVFTQIPVAKSGFEIGIYIFTALVGCAIGYFLLIKGLNRLFGNSLDMQLLRAIKNGTVCIRNGVLENVYDTHRDGRHNTTCDVLFSNHVSRHYHNVILSTHERINIGTAGVIVVAPDDVSLDNSHWSVVIGCNVITNYDDEKLMTQDEEEW